MTYSKSIKKVTKAIFDEFILQPSLEIIRVSYNYSKYWYTAFKERKAKGYHILVVHPGGEKIEGMQPYLGMKALRQKVGGEQVAVSPTWVQAMVRKAHEAGIGRIWLQQESESRIAIHYCQQDRMGVIYGICIPMFTRSITLFHKPLAE